MGDVYINKEYVLKIEAENARLKEENELLKQLLDEMDPRARGRRFRRKKEAENARLKAGLEDIIDYEVGRKKRGIGYDLYVHDRAVEALVF